ncbi:hypothetical protein L2E82_37894 [Cichorium intybus]|uniref:Uncharacterized protein n=1 Tax=Cichorium intybus TaxID=13427 RepID=A0ACB9AEI1_CICIN|nr:hypothetical protein L2E82_37894 [Cichorium intybus]
MIQRNLERFQNPGFMAENQQLLPTEATNFNESMFAFGLENEDQVQMIQNDNSTTRFDPSITKATIVGIGGSSKHALSREIIAQHFNKPIKQAANDLNVGTTQLKKHCRQLGIKRWPQRKIKSLQTLINRNEEFGSDFNEATELSRDLIPSLEKEKEATIEGSHSDLTDTTKKLRQASHKAAYKKRRIQEM